jgi:hypothetical protein
LPESNHIPQEQIMTNAFRLKDFSRRPAPDAVQLQGFLGSRFEGSRVNRLQHQEEDHLLWPFQEHCAVGFYPDRQPKPGIRGDWQGEFMGTWMDAAILSSWNAHDEPLRAKVDNLMKAWLAT